MTKSPQRHLTFVMLYGPSVGAQKCYFVVGLAILPVAYFTMINEIADEPVNMKSFESSYGLFDHKVVSLRGRDYHPRKISTELSSGRERIITYQRTLTVCPNY